MGQTKSKHRQRVSCEPAKSASPCKPSNLPLKSSSLANKPSTAMSTDSLQCSSCMEPVTGTTIHNTKQMPCGHAYCEDCIKKQCLLALADRSLVPARCCRMEYPTDYVQSVLETEDFATYSRFLAERDWRQSDLASDTVYAEMVQSIGGRQCSTCGVGVQKIDGCNFITCPRGHAFCYQCGRVGGRGCGCSGHL